MRWASAVSEDSSLESAVAACAAEVKPVMGDAVPDLAVVFVSAHHSGGYDDLPSLLRQAVGDSLLIGCSGGGIIGAGKEVEHSPGFALTTALLPDVEMHPFHIDDSGLPDGDAPPDAWESLVGAAAADDPNLLLLADPFSIRGEDLLLGLDYAFPRSTKIGGLASGGSQVGGNALFAGRDVHRSGAVGIAMHGNIAVDTVVAQGCKPIGRRMRVTSCQGNMLLELDGQTPLEVLREMFEELDERDQSLAQHSLFLGVVMDEFNEDPKLGDFLVRNILGVDSRSGGLAVGERLREGQNVQFHLRDTEASSLDLQSMLSQYAGDHQPGLEAGAMLFQCLGRGSHLFGRPDHDTDMFREMVGAIPLTGFFCNGEIGQVGGSTYLHGYTSSFGIFRPRA